MADQSTADRSQSPLAGKRIVVTRRADQAAGFCEALEKLGAIPISVPSIECSALASDAVDTARRKIAAYDWVLLTSTNAVRFFLAGLPSGATVPQLAAVGPRTADTILAAGYAVAAQPARATGVDLAHALGDLRDKRILLPRSRRGRPEIVAALAEQGARVDDVAVYDTVDARPTAAMLDELAEGVDIVTFTSPSTVAGFARHVDRELWRRALIACIGPTSAAAAADAGFAVAIVPDEYTVDGLIAAMQSYFGK